MQIAATRGREGGENLYGCRRSSVAVFHGGRETRLFPDPRRLGGTLPLAAARTTTFMALYPTVGGPLPLPSRFPRFLALTVADIQRNGTRPPMPCPALGCPSAPPSGPPTAPPSSQGHHHPLLLLQLRLLFRRAHHTSHRHLLGHGGCTHASHHILEPCQSAYHLSYAASISGSILSFAGLFLSCMNTLCHDAISFS